MSNCQHRHSTVTRGYLEDGSPVAIHQCDDCGLTLPAIEPGDVDIWALPETDTKALATAWQRIWVRLFGQVEKQLANVINFAKGAKP